MALICILIIVFIVRVKLQTNYAANKLVKFFTYCKNIESLFEYISNDSIFKINYKFQ